MKKQRVFRKYEEQPGLFFVLAVLSAGLALLWYDWFLETTYFYNRKTLLKILKDKSYTRLEKTESFFTDIDMYILEVEGETYDDLWVWKDRTNNRTFKGVTLGYDHIGLFHGGYLSKRMTKEIAKLIDQNATKL